MARKASLNTNIITAFASAFLSAGAVLLLITSLTTPTRKGSYLTRVQGVNQNGVFNLDLGTLGGCSDFLGASSGNERDLDCRETFGNGYQSILLLPPLPDIFGDTISVGPDRGYPYTLDATYQVVTYGMTRGLVMIPIAAAFGFVAMILFIFASHKFKAALDWATTALASLTAIMAWASFGIAYQLTNKVEKQLERYNNEALHNGFTLNTMRGNATWILLAGALLMTLALPLIVVRQSMAKRTAEPAFVGRKSSADDV